MATAPIRVLIVDDSVVYRKVVRDVLIDAPDVEVVGVAANGRIALESTRLLKPDLFTLDLEMPELDGLGVLAELKRRESGAGAIMLSALTESGAKLTTTALELGAFDFVLKPSGVDAAANAEQLRRDLLPKIAAFAKSRRAISRPPSGAAVPAASFAKSSSHAPEIVVIGVSTGGPAALAQLLPSLPSDFPLPIVIVQHMPPVFTRTLAEGLDQTCPLHVQEGEDGAAVAAGNVYIAPGGKQVKLARSMLHTTLRVTDDPPEKNCRPSVDYLFRSVAELYRGRALGVVMTGMGDDGTVGCRLLKRHGAKIVVQDAASSVVYGMPRSVVEAGLADVISPLDGIAGELKQAVAGATLCR